jgi:hypothetical protein
MNKRENLSFNAFAGRKESKLACGNEGAFGF